jgi:outer membrane protein OmpA-like peptidoglycan-associated protein
MGNSQYPEWEKLKQLLVGDERKMIQQIIDRLDSFNIQSEELCELLPEAIRRSLQKGNKLTQAFIPLLNDTFKQSIEQDPNELTNALYALIGPATRKSVSEALKSMLQSFNSAMQSTFSWQGIKWRYESLVSGKSFSEVVLMHTLIYQVEQVFLIHKKSGLLLESAKLETVFLQDADMVSSMLRAIQDFVHDSFNLKDNESLNTLNIGELTVWVEECPDAVLALVIRGNAPESLREQFSEAIEAIHFQYKNELNEFEGDTEPFEYLKPDLESLLFQKTSEKEKKSKPVIAIFILTAIAIIIFSFIGYKIWDSWKWSDYKEELEQAPGFIIIEDGHKDGKRYLSGFKDEYAEYPKNLWKRSGYDSTDIILDFEPYQSNQSEFVIKRAKSVLKAPESVNFDYNNGTLILKGYASQQWIDKAIEFALLINGVQSIDIERMKISDGLQIDSVVNTIESTSINFQFNSNMLIPGQEKKVKMLLELMNKLSIIAGDKRIIIEIMGNTCSSGSELRNEKLSWNRARRFLEIIGQKNIKKIDFLLKGLGNKNPLVEEKSEEDKKKNRRVSFDVIIN